MPAFSSDISDYLYILSQSRWAQDRAKVGLVLSGGAAKGIAHVGVLQCWEEWNFPVDLIVGTSVGSLAGGLYATGMSVAAIANMGADLNWKKLVEFKITPVRMLNLSSIVSNERMGALLTSYIGEKTFEDLKIPFICIACDLKTGEKIIFKEGRLIPAIRASSSIPGIFEPVSYKHRLLVDGGVIDNVPTDIAKDSGMDMIVASWAGGSTIMEDTKNIISVLTQVISISGTLLSKEQLKLADVVISPNMDDISPLDIDKFSQAQKKGYEECLKKTGEIRHVFLVKTLEKIKEAKRAKLSPPDADEIRRGGSEESEE
ncbi:MAG: patatin-like phospholipase family protein [bacterium]